MKRYYIVIIIFVLLILSGSVFILDHRQQALIVQFGEVVDVRSEPGLNLKVPMLQDVVLYDNRILDINMEPQEIIALDRKRLIVDAYAKYHITDPLKYYQSVRNDDGLASKFRPVLESMVRNEIGRVKLVNLISTERTSVMEAIKENANKVAGNYGIEVVDVRIMRTDLPQENGKAIYERMKAQHEKEARQTRAEGVEEALKITAGSDKDAKIIMADAKKKSEIIRGGADATAAKIFADAFNRDPEFYSFYRSMQAYKKTIAEKDTKVVLSPDSEFMRYFGDINGAGRK